MRTLPRKTLRTLTYEVNRLFTPSSYFVPQSLEDLRSLTNPLAREVKLRDRPEIWLSDSGLATFQTIVRRLHDQDISEGLAQYSDIWNTAKAVLGDLNSDGLATEDGAEFVQLIGEKLKEQIATHTFVVPIYGVELKGVDGLRLGSFRITDATPEKLKDLGADPANENVRTFLDHAKHYLCLTATARGTTRAARSSFEARAHLATGVLAAVAASLYQRGAHAFRIGIVMRPEEGYGKASFLSWTDRTPSLSLTLQYATSQPLTIDEAMRARIEGYSLCQYLFRIVESDARTQLEEAIVRALYWYADAHRDLLTEMRLLKYWSCVETFFSSTTETTKSVVDGLVTILVSGPFPAVPVEEIDCFKRRLVQLYDSRSRATHGAKYGHVTDEDVGDFSQWVSWMIFNVLAFSGHGYATPQAVKTWVQARTKTEGPTRLSIASLVSRIRYWWRTYAPGSNR